MAMKSALLIPLVLALFTDNTLRAESVADRKGAVLKDRAAMEHDARWIYNDFERGFTEGKRTGKPVLIVLRCIPCLACAGIDARVLLDKSDLDSLLDQFVCVRVINANALDLTRFQFDFDLSFSTLVFNGDGTLYGRYGSWTHQKNPKENAIDGFRKALEASLELHKGYPENRPALAAKQAQSTPYKSPVEMPTIQGKYTRQLDWEGKVVQSCVHCHQIGDALRISYRQSQQKIPSNLIYPFPEPESIGLTLFNDHAVRIKSVAPGSTADKAGLKANDDLLTMAGQPLISSADVSWVLHHTAESAEVSVSLQRGPERLNLRLTLPDGWRATSDISRRVGTWQMRAMALGGLFLEELPEAERTRLGLKSDQLALFAKHVGEYGEHATAKKAGYKKGDVVVEIAGITSRQTEGQVIGHLLRRYNPGDKIQSRVLRNGQFVEMEFPIQ